MKVVESEIVNLKKVLKSFVKVSKSVLDEEEEFKKYINTINKINSLTSDVMSMDGHSFEEWQIPDFLSWLIIPSKVGMMDTFQAKDLIKRSEYALEETVKTMSYVEFMNYSVALIGAMRGNSSQLQAMSAHRRFVQFDSNVALRHIKDGNTGEMGQLPLHLSVQVFKDYMYVHDCGHVVDNLTRVNLTKCIKQS